MLEHPNLPVGPTKSDKDPLSPQHTPVTLIINKRNLTKSTALEAGKEQARPSQPPGSERKPPGTPDEQFPDHVCAVPGP